MANYDHIVRVVIRKPTSIQSWCQALEELEDAKTSAGYPSNSGQARYHSSDGL